MNSPELPAVRQIRDSDPEPVIAALNAAGHEVRLQAASGEACYSSLDFVRLPRVELFRIGFPRFRARNVQPIEFTGITLPDGTAFHSAREKEGIGPGHCHVMHPGRGFDLQADDDGAMFVVNFLPPMAQAISTALGGRERLDLRTAAGAAFHRFARYAWTEARVGSLPRAPAVLTQMEDLLESLLVEACSQSERVTPAGERAVPRHVRIAQELIEAHLDEPLPMTRLAATTGVSASTLTRAFRRLHSMGPIAYVRQRRLIRARAQLLASERNPGDVTEIAMRCGFTHLSRFARDYARAFGELPSETLRR